MSAKETIGVRAERDVIEALREMGDQENRTLSNMAGVALKRYVEARKKTIKAKDEVK